MTGRRRRYRPLHRRRRRWFHRVARWLFLPLWLPAHLLAVAFLFGWDDIVNLFGGALDIAQRIRDIVQDAIGVVWNFFSRAIDWVTTWLNTIQDWELWAVDWFTKRIDGAVDWLSGLDDFARRIIPGWVTGLVNDVRGFASWVLDTARNEFHALYDTAIGAVDNLMRWTIDNVFSPLAGIAGTLGARLDQLAGWIPGRIQQVIDWTEQRIWDVAHAVVAPFVDVWNFVTGELIPMWRKVWGWLEFLAEHPFDWFTQLLQSVVNKGSRVLVGSLLAAATRNMDVVEQTVADWLSS